MINQNIVFKVRGNEYTVSSPNIAQLIQIELMKVSLSNGNYSTLIKTGTAGAINALDNIDMVAIISVLVPKLLEDLKIPSKNLMSLNIQDAKELLKEYKEQLLPWINSWLKEVNE